MKLKSFTLLLAVMMTAAAVAQQTPVTRANYELAARFSPKKLEKMVFTTRVDPHWLKLSERFWYEYETSEGKMFYLVDPEKPSRKPMFDPVKMAADLTRLSKDPWDAKHLPIKEIRFNEEETAFIFGIESSQDEEPEEGEETKGKPKKKMLYFEYTLATADLRMLEEYEKPKDKPRWANISPDGEKIVFARHYNLYWMDRENYEKALEDEKDSTIVEHALTTDGEEYYEYGSGGRGETNVDKEKNKDKRKPVYGIWSHDSEKFALIRTDEREVKELWVINSIAEPRPTLETYKYHMPGEKEAPRDELLIFEIASGKRVEVKADRFPDQSLSLLQAPRKEKNRDDEYTPSLWLSETSDKLYFTRTSRDLKRIDVCVADASTGEVTPLIEERMNTYIELRNLGLVNNGQELIHWSERDGWAHFYLYDGEGNLKNQITSGPWHCEDIIGIDEKARVLYFTANGREEGEDPYYLHLYRVNFDGSGLKLLNPGNFDHAVRISDSHRFFVDNFSRVNTVPRSALYDHQGRQVLDLETADLSLLFAAGYRFPETFKVKADDGITDLYGVMYKPFDFDSTRSYPLIEYVYPGPQTESVNKSFSARMDRLDRLAQLGFIVITVGNRGGHPSRSKWYHNYGYGNLRDYGLADKKAAAEQLAWKHPFIDINRVGIFGHSGGGFMSTAAMLVYPDFFKVAVSSSGNHENNIYNRWWSEKHHGVQEVQDTSGNVRFEYDIDKNSELAKNLKGHLLITTGDIDNNVHPAGTIRLANALIKANKRFDFFLFPGQRHGYGDMDEYFFWLRGEYFCRHLLGDTRTEADIVEMNLEKEQNGK
ncbi:MAG: DPP IV N-terminal domain-containing protein [Bacteroidales bacterium]